MRFCNLEINILYPIVSDGKSDLFIDREMIEIFWIESNMANLKIFQMGLLIEGISRNVNYSKAFTMQSYANRDETKEEGPFWPFLGPTRRKIPHSGCCRRGLEVLKTIFLKFFSEVLRLFSELESRELPYIAYGNAAMPHCNSFLRKWF